MILRYLTLLLALLFCLVTFVLDSKQQVEAISITPKQGTPSATITTTVIDKLKKIEILKEKIATKVAELREKEKAALYGTVKKVDQSTVTILGRTSEQAILVSDDTIYYTLTEDGKAESTTKKMKEGVTLVAFGYFDESRTTFSAKYIYFISLPVHKIGKIADIDKNNYTITVKETKGSTIVDVETDTKTFSYTKKTGLSKIGFSKLKVGSTTHVVGSQNARDQNRISADRIYMFTFESQASPSATP